MYSLEVEGLLVREELQVELEVVQLLDQLHLGVCLCLEGY